MKKIYDVSLTLSEETLNWPTDPPFKSVPFKSISKGGSSNVSTVTMGTHFGTHIDPPRHIFNEGTGAAEIPLEALVGEAVVVDAGDVRMIGLSEIKSFKIPDDCRVLFKTKNSDYWRESPKKFHDEFVSLTAEAARYLVEKKTRLVGIDYMSIEAPGDKSHPVHRIFLSAGIAVVENLDLSAVPPGKYTLVCAPLKLKNGDGAPCRVFLLQE